jgi:hypothetical protein
MRCIPQTPERRPTLNPNIGNLLIKVAREVFKEDDSRRNKMKHFFLKITKVLDTELTEA